jgi:hypothetical protein
MSPELKKRQEGLSEDVKEIAWKAQHRLRWTPFFGPKRGSA